MPLKPPVSDNDHSAGDARAIIDIVEYGDYQCPHCARAHPIVQKLQHEFGQRMRFTFRNFPLAMIHPEATLAAIASEAAARQQKFWPMHDLLFENQDDLEEEAILYYANQLTLDINQFQRDLADETLAEKVENDFESGIRSGVNATPSFFINGEKYNNGWESDRMERYIKEQLKLL